MAMARARIVDVLRRSRAGVDPLGWPSFGMLAVVLLAVYAPGWHLAPYADDLMVMIAAEVGITGGAYADEIMFRPLELFVLGLSFILTGTPELAKLANFAGLLLTAGMLFWLGRRLDPASRALPVVLAALFACHPGNVIAVSEIDTVSQQYATVCVVAVFAWYLFGPRQRPVGYHAVGAGLALLALLSKEAAVGAVFALPVAAAVVDLLGRAEPLRPTLRRALLALGCLSLVFAIYMGLRWAAGATLVADPQYPRYALDPFNLVRNAILLLGSVAYLGSTLEVFVLRAPWRVVVSGLLTLGVLGLAALGALGLLRERRTVARRPAAVLGAACVMIVASLFPVALIGWPGELHGYLPRPFYTLVVGVLAVRGVAAIARRASLSGRAGAMLAGAGVVTLAGWMLFGVSEKLAYAAQPAARSEAFLAQMTAWYAARSTLAEPVVTCVLDTEASETPVYSVYTPRSYSLVQPIADWLNHRHGRWLDLPPFPAPLESCRLVIEVEGDRLALRAVDR